MNSADPDLSSTLTTLSGSTTLQCYIKENQTSPKTRDVLNLVLSSPIYYINHPRATYVVQTLIPILSEEDLSHLVQILTPNLAVLAKNKCGTRVIQVLLRLPHLHLVKVS